MCYYWTKGLAELVVGKYWQRWAQYTNHVYIPAIYIRHKVNESPLRRTQKRILSRKKACVYTYVCVCMCVPFTINNYGIQICSDHIQRLSPKICISSSDIIIKSIKMVGFTHEKWGFLQLSFLRAL